MKPVSAASGVIDAQRIEMLHLTRKPADAAREYYHNALATLKPGQLTHENTFLAGHAHAVKEFQSIWKKPEERPTKNKVKNYGVIPYTEIVTVTKDGQMRDVRYYHYPSGPHNIGGEVTHWAYISDFLKTLPDFAKEAE